jgi:hypothetical protein
MRFHTSLTTRQVNAALSTAILTGNVAPDVYLVALSPHGSRTHTRAFEIQLGAVNRNSLPAGVHRSERQAPEGTPVQEWNACLRRYLA